MPAAGHRALYLAIVQFVFVSTWTIYIVFLPELLQRAGLDTAWLPRIVIADQVLMAIFDLAFGVAAARGLQRYGRIAPSCSGSASFPASPSCSCRKWLPRHRCCWH